MIVLKKDMNEFLKRIGRVAIVYGLWILAHFISSHLYANWCVPLTWWGLFMSPFVAPMPHCQAFRWIIATGGNIMVHMWVLLGIWIISYLPFTKTI
jgi:hypothetical protein